MIHIHFNNNTNKCTLAYVIFPHAHVIKFKFKFSIRFAFSTLLTRINFSIPPACVLIRARLHDKCARRIKCVYGFSYVYGYTARAIDFTARTCARCFPDCLKTRLPVGFVNPLTFYYRQFFLGAPRARCD